jgi:hypothetical protein
MKKSEQKLLEIKERVRLDAVKHPLSPPFDPNEWIELFWLKFNESLLEGGEEERDEKIFEPRCLCICDSPTKYGDKNRHVENLV